MTEKWRKYLDKDVVSRTLLTDLCKAFDCLLHDLLIAKLAPFAFNYESLTLIQSYLSNRQQQGSDKPGKPGKNSVFCDTQGKPGKLRESKKIFQIPGKLREFC